ncbi:putative Chromodomain-helicase-DNA-binding protein [Podospora australis]|uniref:Chromodomain-helicase-DNA-binding protein n=1 Tax=Podospora australis TaxID=1536484 RepID=A0AAN6WYR4_9PEZI|nr:putative Chromodomain-helicase-DNA-binding protein [Podospora australis]
MVHRGFLDSEDELFVGELAATEPASYEFQLELSDDDEAPDPLGLDEITQPPPPQPVVTDAPILPTIENAGDIELEDARPVQEVRDSASEADFVSAMASEPESQSHSIEIIGTDIPTASGDPDEHEKRNGYPNGIEKSVSVLGGSKPLRTIGIEVALPWLSKKRRGEYEYVEVPEMTPDYEFRRTRRHNGDHSFGDFYEEGSRKRKRSGDDEAYSGDDYDEDSNEGVIPRTRGAPTKLEPMVNYDERRRALRASTRETHRPSRYQDLERDELQDSDGDDGSFIVMSDIVRPGRKRKVLKKLLTRSTRTSARAAAQASARTTATRDDSDIEFEPSSRRRSSRNNKNSRRMVDGYDDDDDDDEIFYAEEKAPPAPKVISVKEIFQPNSSLPADFQEAHRHICDTCGYADDRNKGALIPCQGCSNTYHRTCLGTRSSRDQIVTKVAEDAFVMQCRFCIGLYKKRDHRAPHHDACQGCHTKGPSCAAFSQKKTPKQEEKLREENRGVDPIVGVNPKLINNADNVLFRCAKCHRGWHYEHLPHPNQAKDPSITDPLNLRKHRLEEYQVNWSCKECRDMEDGNLKPDKLVAWRPVDRKMYTQGQTITDFTEDQLEYLVKWEKKSYNHCVWLPGAWCFGVIKPAMRHSFIKRTFGEGLEDADEEMKADNLLRWTEKEAIYSAWVTPDIILDVIVTQRSAQAEARYRAMSRQDKFEDDMARIFHVTKILVKFEGLGYEDVVWDTPPDSERPTIWSAYLEAYREYLNGKHFKSESHKAMRERVNEFRQLDYNTEIKLKEQPKGLQRGKLMKYQLDGLNWMLHNYRNDRSIILADEMGLGKTVQVVALLSALIQHAPRVWPFLVVVPNATCANWRREIKKWAPDLRVVAYYGGRASQTLSLNYELFPNQKQARDLKAHVVIMSYDSAKDTETKSRFSSVKWAGLIVDEAQALKNDENTLYKALNQMNIPFKLLLTGTPLQNNKRELFNLVQFVDPEKKAEKMDQEFAEITSENLPKLHQKIREYFLRRTKAQVLTFLPPMAQIVIPVSMTVLQEKLCRSVMERNPQLIRSIFASAGKLKPTERGSLSNILMQLRKCLCHPFIYSQAIEDRTVSAELARRNLVEASSKLMLLEIMLPKLKERGHRVLIFSQFLEQLTILEDFLVGMKLKHERLDGSQSSMEKQKKIDAFNAPNSEIFAMLLSTRAGGVGINLATADTVIIMDPDWNPHQDIQALSRAHRIGQLKKVLCFQLMTVDSAEEKILQIGRKKLALDHLLIESMDNQEEAPNDVESVLKHGAAALFGEGKKKDAIVYDDAAVNKLLDRSTEEETKMDGDKSAESAFAFARVWDNNEGGLAEDVKETAQNLSLSVWDQILQQRAEEAQREAEKELERLGRGGRRRGTANYTNPKFEFEEGVPPGESDHSDADANFVGSDKSNGDSSEDERGTLGSGISGNSNVKKQGKPTDPGAQSQDIPAQGHSQNQQQDAKSKRIRFLEVSIPNSRQSSAQGDARNPNQKAAGPGQNQVETPIPVPTVPRPRQPLVNGTAGIGTAAGLANGRRPGPVIFKHAPVAAPGAASPIGPPPSVLLSQQQQYAMRLTNPPPPQQYFPEPQYAEILPITSVLEPCLVCTYIHPEGWDCPESTSMAKIRIALDKVKRDPSISPPERSRRQQLLWLKLQRLHTPDQPPLQL